MKEKDAQNLITLDTLVYGLNFFNEFKKIIKSIKILKKNLKILYAKMRNYIHLNIKTIN